MDYYYISKGDDNLVFNRNESVSDYAVVCATDCRADWTDVDKVHLRDTDFRYRDLGLLEDCKRDCERFPNCSSVDFEPRSIMFIYGCKENFYPYDISKRYEYFRGSHHVIDRSSKTIQSCIADYVGMLFILLALLGIAILICVLLMMNLEEGVQFLSMKGRTSISQESSII